jgi:hypothetical protein
MKFLHRDPEIRRRDLSVFGARLLKKWPVLAIGLILTASILALGPGTAAWIFMNLGLMILGYGVFKAWQGSLLDRFRHRRFKLLWENAQDRLKRLDAAMASLKRAEVADLKELPKTIEAVANGLYIALRRADAALSEVSQSEGFLLSQRDAPPPAATDPQAAKLWEAAHLTQKEYRRLLAGLLGSVERTEAQAALFTATLDTLRVKTLGYRLVGRPVEAPSVEFLRDLAEARMQLDSIDKALEELEMTPFPNSVEEAPEQALQRLKDLADAGESLAGLYPQPPSIPESVEEGRGENVERDKA